MAQKLEDALLDALASAITHETKRISGIRMGNDECADGLIVTRTTLADLCDLNAGRLREDRVKRFAAVVIDEVIKTAKDFKLTFQPMSGTALRPCRVLSNPPALVVIDWDTKKFENIVTVGHRVTRERIVMKTI